MRALPTLLLALAIAMDGLLLFAKRKGISARREAADRFSVGDPNKVAIHLRNHYVFPVRVSVIDELPIQFQERNWIRKSKMDANASCDIDYHLERADEDLRRAS